MEATSINLLTREGGIRATFTPKLTPDQSTALANAIRHDGDTAAEMADILNKLALAWGCQVVVEPC